MAQEEQTPPSSGKSASAQMSLNAAGQKSEQEINLSIRFLSEELLQISELSEMERGYATELASYLKQFLEPLGTPFHLKPSSILRSDSSLADVILTPQGTLILMHNNGMVNSKPLESLQTDTILRILNELIPEIKASLAERRQKISGRVGMLEKATREFRRIPPPAAASGGAPPAAGYKRAAPQAAAQAAAPAAYAQQAPKEAPVPPAPTTRAAQVAKAKDLDQDDSQDALKAALTGN